MFCGARCSWIRLPDDGRSGDWRCGVGAGDGGGQPSLTLGRRASSRHPCPCLLLDLARLRSLGSSMPSAVGAFFRKALGLCCVHDAGGPLAVSREPNTARPDASKARPGLQVVELPSDRKDWRFAGDDFSALSFKSQMRLAQGSPGSSQPAKGHTTMKNNENMQGVPMRPDVEANTAAAIKSNGPSPADDREGRYAQRAASTVAQPRVIGTRYPGAGVGRTQPGRIR